MTNTKANDADPVQPVNEVEPVADETSGVYGGPDYNELAEIQARAAEGNREENEKLRKEIAKDREKAEKKAEPKS